MFKRLLQTCAAAMLAGASAIAGDVPAAPDAAAQPAMIVDVRQGQIFSYALPRGWKPSETICGVDMTAPDAVTAVSHLFFHGHQGRTSPDGMVQFAISKQATIGISNTRVISSKALAPNVKMYLTSFTYRGHDLRGLSICAVSNLPFGGFYTESVMIQSPPETLERDAQVLMQVAHSVTCTNGSALCGNDQLIQLQTASGGGASLNHPNTAGDTLMSSWENKNRSQARTTQNFSDATLGRSRWTDGSTQYIAPNNATRVFVTPGGTAYYKTDWSSPPPPNTTEVQPAR